MCICIVIDGKTRSVPLNNLSSVGIFYKKCSVMFLPLKMHLSCHLQAPLTSDSVSDTHSDGWFDNNLSSLF